MERLTRKKGCEFLVSKEDIICLENEYSGLAIERLGKFEDIQVELIELRRKIEDEMDRLREMKKTKSCRFQELFAQKVVNDRLLTIFEFKGL